MVRVPAYAALAACMVCAAYAASPAQAQMAQTPPSSGQPAAPVAPFFAGGSPLVPGWSFTLTPYGWLSNVSTKINIPTRGGGVATTDVYVPFDDLLRDLRFAALLSGEARYDRFSVVTDIMYINLGMNLSAAHLSSVNPGSGSINIPKSTQVNVSTGMGTTIWTLAGGYTLAMGGWGNIDAIAGARLLAIDVTTRYDLNVDLFTNNGTLALSKSGSLSASGADWDAIIGARGRIDIPNSSFYVPFYFDIGTGELPLTWQAYSGLGYHTSWADYSLGYRYLAYENNGNAHVKSLAMGGVMMAASFHF
jgi:hypothetical protein